MMPSYLRKGWQMAFTLPGEEKLFFGDQDIENRASAASEIGMAFLQAT